MADPKGKIISLNMPKAAAYDASAERERNFIGSRINEARRDKKISMPTLSRMLADYGVQITATGVNKWELGRSVPSAYQLLAVAHALGLEEDLQFFIGGRTDLNADGRRKLAEYKKDLVATGLYKPVEPKAKIQYIEKLVSNLPASAGPGEFMTEENFEKVRFPENAVPPDADFGIYVSGNSMEPVYRDGQIVWVHACETLVPGEVGVFIYDGSGYLKMYDEQTPDEAVMEDFTDSYGNVHPQPVLVSYNEEYRPIVISPHTNFSVVGRIVS